MTSSIARRFYKTSFIVSLVSIVVMMAAILVITEDMEQLILQQDFLEHRDFILGEHNLDEPLHWRTSNLIAVYIPKSLYGSIELPPIFTNLPDNHAIERTQQGHEYLINIETIKSGRLYIARNITLVEKREMLFFRIIMIVGVVIILLSFLLAVASSRRLTKPLKLLSEHIRRTQVGKDMPKISMDFKDVELSAIAATFNTFLAELEQFVRRERSLVNMASHELRTPISVILGAVEVLQSRGNLTGKDMAALKRIENAGNEMQENISVLLRLSRREADGATAQNLNLFAVLQEVLEDLAESYDVDRCIAPAGVSAERVYADKTLVKMLIRNLIQNALQHTAGTINIRVAEGVFEVIDQGKGLSDEQRAMLRNYMSSLDQNGYNGLGLYIVTLICERLKWELTISENNDGGTTMMVEYH